MATSVRLEEIGVGKGLEEAVEVINNVQFEKYILGHMMITI